MENYSYKNLVVWQKAMELSLLIYSITKNYPHEELYGLTSQTRRAAVSIPANIAEGRMRGGKPEFQRFLSIAYGSGAELETHLEIAKRLSFAKSVDFQKLDGLLLEVMKMLNKMRQTRWLTS